MIFQTETIIKVDYNDFDTFIKEKYGLSSFYGTLESGNDTDHRYDCSKVDDFFDKDDFQEILDNNSCNHWELGTVIEGMIRDGHLQRGVYLVRVSW